MRASLSLSLSLSLCLSLSLSLSPSLSLTTTALKDLTLKAGRHLVVNLILRPPPPLSLSLSLSLSLWRVCCLLTKQIMSRRHTGFRCYVLYTSNERVPTLPFSIIKTNFFYLSISRWEISRLQELQPPPRPPPPPVPYLNMTGIFYVWCAGADLLSLKPKCAHLDFIHWNMLPVRSDFTFR